MECPHFIQVRLLGWSARQIDMSRNRCNSSRGPSALSEIKIKMPKKKRITLLQKLGSVFSVFNSSVHSLIVKLISIDVGKVSMISCECSFVMITTSFTFHVPSTETFDPGLYLSVVIVLFMSYTL